MDINKKIRIFKKPSVSITLKQIFIALTIVMAFACSLSLGATALRFLRVGDIKIVGVSPYDLSDFKEALKIKRSQFWWAIDEDELEEAIITELPQIGKVKVTKKLPNDIEINVIESRTPRWYIDITGRKYSLDSEMYVIEEIRNTNGVTELVLPNISRVMAREVPVFGQSDTEIKKTLEIIDTVRHSDLSSRITRLDLYDRSNIVLVIDGKYTAKLGNSDDLSGKLTTIKSTLERDDVKNSGGGEFNAQSYPRDGYVSFLPSSASTY